MNKQYKIIYENLILSEQKLITKIDIAQIMKDNKTVFSENIELDSLIYNYKKQLTKIKATIAQITSGSNYGVCTNCMEKINIQRLKATPLTKLCIECQSDTELSHL